MARAAVAAGAFAQGALPKYCVRTGDPTNHAAEFRFYTRTNVARYLLGGLLERFLPFLGRELLPARAFVRGLLPLTPGLAASVQQRRRLRRLVLAACVVVVVLSVSLVNISEQLTLGVCVGGLVLGLSTYLGIDPALGVRGRLDGGPDQVITRLDLDHVSNEFARAAALAFPELQTSGRI